MQKKRSGILLHITSLPSQYGIGDLGVSAYNFIDFLVQAKQTYWQVLPLNRPVATSGFSPYFSLSAFALNPLFICFESLMSEGLLSKDDVVPIPTKNLDVVDFSKVTKYKYDCLNKAYDRFKEKKTKEFEAFCVTESSWLDDYALFIALKNKFQGKAWNQWPDELKKRKKKALENAVREFSKDIEREKFFQFVLSKQWFSLKAHCDKNGIKIIGDIPIYVSYDSVDVWVNPQNFKLDENFIPTVVSGVPPDYFSETGQLWNNPVYRWDVLKQDKYLWWIKRMEHVFKYFDILRIDHFRGLVQYWEVPRDEKTAVNGSWQDVPTYDFFDTAINYFKELPVIAEDLGFITEDVREVMVHYKFPGMKVFQFAFGEDDPFHPYLPNNYYENCVAYTGTHDNNTLMGWIKDEIRPEEKKRLMDYLMIDEFDDNINWKIIKEIMASKAEIVIFPMQDILGLGKEARMNQPKNAEGNWQWRLELNQIKPVHIEKLLSLTKTFGRTNLKARRMEV